MKNKYNLNFGIVIIGYSNVDGIKRLLDSLDRVDFGNDELTLIFSIDYSGKMDVADLADTYSWKHGKKVVKAYKSNLGLRTHILKCGDYIDEYELDALIVLEDDIFVSPNAYRYALEAVHYYKDDKRISGISLYKHEYNINAKHPFCALNDGHDTFFMQYAQSWGQVWLRDQWHSFKKWYELESWKKLDSRLVPDNLKKWQNSWLKYHIMYCIDTDTYFVYPYNSLTTDFSDVGVHGSRQNTDMQVPLDYSIKREWHFASLDESMAVYDAFFQNITIKRMLSCENVLLDYYGVREVSDSIRYVLSTKYMNCKIIKSWGLQLRPIEANIIYDIPGNDIFLYDITQSNDTPHKKNKGKVFEYDLKGMNIVNVDNISYCSRFLFHYIGIKLKRIKKKMKGKRQ